MTTLGHASRQRGHRVSLIGILDAEERVRAAGLEVVPFGLADHPAGCTRELFHRLGELRGPAAFRATVARLRSAIDRVWGHPSSRQNAQRLQQANRASGGVARAADIVEQAISSGRADMQRGYPEFDDRGAPGDGVPFTMGRIRACR